MRLAVLLAVVAMCFPPRVSEIDMPSARPICKGGKCGKR